MRSDVEQYGKADHSLGIRAGVWLIVIGLLLLCVLTISLFRREAISPEGKVASNSRNAVHETSPIRPKPDASRPIRRLSASPFVNGGAGQVSATLTPDEVRTLASAMANEKARELYDCEPFGNGPPAQRVEGGWVWFDRRARGAADIEATVHFAADGSTHSVDVILLDTRPR